MRASLRHVAALVALVGAPARAEVVGSADVTLPVPVVELPARVPLRVVPSALVEVRTCGGPTWECGGTRATRSAAPFVVDAVVWPASPPAFVLEAAGAPSAVTGAALMHVVGTTGDAGPGREISADGVLRIEDVGDLARTHPSVLDGFGAFIVIDSARVDVKALLAFVERGGVASVRRSGDVYGPELPLTAAPRNASWTVAPRTDGPRTRLEVPPGTVVVDRGLGRVVVRPRDATLEEELAGVVAARPSLLTALDGGEPGQSAAAIAAAAGVAAARVPAPLGFTLALAAIVLTAVAVRRARARGFAHALAAAAVVAGSATALLLVVDAVLVPAERRARVATWTGVDGDIETVAEAVRPRASGDVTIAGARAPDAVDVLHGDATAIFDDRASSVTAHLDSRTTLVGVWRERPPHRRAVTWRATEGGVEIENHLDVALDYVVVDNGASIGGPVPAHGSLRAFSPRDGARAGDVAAARVTQEIARQCSARSGGAQGSSVEPTVRCGVAVLHQPDGTLLGIEVSR